MHTVYVNIGSNLGSRRSNLLKAIESISSSFGVCCISTPMESEAWGYDSANRFLNIGVAFKSELQALEILDRLQSIEKQISPSSHRDSSGGYIDREIDIDIMAIDSITLDTEPLKLPHPALATREFFLKPMEELNPEWVDPRNGKSIKTLLCELYHASLPGYSVS